MKKLTIGLLATALCLGLSGVALAATDNTTQSVTMTVNEIAVIDVTGNPATLTVTAPVAGGDVPQNATDNSTYAQYTSTVASGLTRSITAARDSSGTAPAGCSLKVVASGISGNEGSAAAQITITTSAQDIITGIGSCNTGTNATDGAQLTYTLSVDTVTSLVAAESKTATITLTLADDA